MKCGIHTNVFFMKQNEKWIVKMSQKILIKGKIDWKPKRSVKWGIKSGMKIKKIKSMTSFKMQQSTDLFVWMLSIPGFLKVCMFTSFFIISHQDGPRFLNCFLNRLKNAEDLDTLLYEYCVWRWSQFSTYFGRYSAEKFWDNSVFEPNRHHPAKTNFSSLDQKKWKTIS